MCRGSLVPRRAASGHDKREVTGHTGIDRLLERVQHWDIDAHRALRLFCIDPDLAVADVLPAEPRNVANPKAGKTQDIEQKAFDDGHVLRPIAAA
jgi:hypothetical protein